MFIPATRFKVCLFSPALYTYNLASVLAWYQTTETAWICSCSQEGGRDKGGVQITNPNIHGYLCARLPRSCISWVKNQ